jgi:hypothetical protein
MDVPSVNWAFYNDLKEDVCDDGKKVFETGSCSLHIVHGAFQRGYAASKWKLNSVLSSLWYLFKDCPARRAVFVEVVGETQSP